MTSGNCGLPLSYSAAVSVTSISDIQSIHVLTRTYVCVCVCVCEELGGRGAGGGIPLLFSQN